MIVLCGKSASGKSMLRDILCDEYGFISVVTYTTRPMRDGEVDGIDYHFISEEEFFIKKDAEFFAEYNSFTMADGKTVYYGSAAVDYEVAADNKVIILTPSGVNAINNKGIEPYIAWIYASNNTQYKRLAARGDSKDEAIRRVRADNADFSGFGEVAHRVFYNNDGADINEVTKKVYDAYQSWLKEKK